MERNHDLEVSKLFEAAASLPYPELSTLYAGISQEHAKDISNAVTDYYASLPDKERFFCCGPTSQNSPAIQVTGWTSWRKNAVSQRAGYYIPSGYTLLVEEILYKAGTEYWLSWLDSLPSHEQTISILLINRQSRDLLQALARACGEGALGKIKALLFCVLVSEALTSSERRAFLSVIENNRSSFFNLCLEVLSDFHFQLAYPKNADICQPIAVIYAGQDALSRLSAISSMTTGAICAWTEFLSQVKPSAEQLAAFKSAYISWISSTDDYKFTTTMRGGYYERELRFLEFVAETYSFDEAFEDEMKTMLEKKTYVYHGWAPEESPRQQWFLHIGLLLWLIGVHRYRQRRGEDLILYVLKKLNLVIPMVLVDSDYSLLLGNVFCIPLRATPEIDAQLICLIRKIFELPVLRGIVENYLGHACHSVTVLCAMRNRLKTLLELPQRKLPFEPEFPGQELLSKIKSALNEHK